MGLKEGAVVDFHVVGGVGQEEGRCEWMLKDRIRAKGLEDLCEEAVESAQLSADDNRLSGQLNIVGVEVRDKCWWGEGSFIEAARAMTTDRFAESSLPQGMEPFTDAIDRGYLGVVG
jgi:hypothetical protein